MREPSDHPSKDGGWYHPYGDERAKMFRPEKKEVAPALVNAEELISKWEFAIDSDGYRRFAATLGIDAITLEWLSAVWAPEYNAWAFPMRDGKSNIIGIRLRSESGDKWAVRGSRQGLFIPSYFEDDDSICYITEGPTDCAAVLTLGLYSIGRPSCNSNHEQLAIALMEKKIRRVVIVSDNDDKRRLNGQQWNPGLDGAKALGVALKLPYVIWIPPTKDVREFLQLGGTKQMIESEIKQKVWKR